MQTPDSVLEPYRKLDIMMVQNIVLCFVGVMFFAHAGAVGPEDGRSLGVFRPYGGGGHYERYGGNGGGFFGKYPGYGYESYTLTGGGFGKPFHGPGFGYGGFFPGHAYPFIPYPGFGGGLGPGYGFGPGFGPGFGYFK